MKSNGPALRLSPSKLRELLLSVRCASTGMDETSSGGSANRALLFSPLCDMTLLNEETQCVQAMLKAGEASVRL